MTRASRVETVAWIDRQLFPIDDGIAPVRITGDKHLHQSLHVPTGFGEIDRKVIQ